MNHSSAIDRPKGFTLVELLIVIGIIALLISILLPALAKARSAAQEAVCMSNLRQWGIGYAMYTDQNHGSLPSDGAGGNSTDPIGVSPVDSNGVAFGTAPNLPINSNGLWFNAIPPLVGQKAYINMLYDDIGGLTAMPHANSHSVFVCPTSGDPTTQTGTEKIINGSYFALSGYNADPTFAIPHGPTNKGLPTGSYTQWKAYFCYAFNSKLFGTQNDGIDREAWKMTQLQPTSAMVLMAEKIVSAGEYTLPAQLGGKSVTAQGYTSNVGQPKACWTRFTTRHRGGGFLLFCDGHVSWYKWQQVQPIVSDINTHVADANRPSLGVIWNPLSSVGNSGSD